MTEKYNRRKSWTKANDGAPLKCILDVGQNIRYRFDMISSIDGLTCIQTRILGHIKMEEEKGNSVFQRDIEDIFRVKRSSVSSVLKNLEKKGLIIRERVSEDARIKKVVLTEDGRKIQKKVLNSINIMEKKIKAELTEKEFVQFLDYMNRIDKKVIELYENK